jgi:hypothetical protein
MTVDHPGTAGLSPAFVVFPGKTSMHSPDSTTVRPFTMTA